MKNGQIFSIFSTGACSSATMVLCQVQQMQQQNTDLNSKVAKLEQVWDQLRWREKPGHSYTME